MTNTATTLVIGRWRGRTSSLNIQFGRVDCWPAVKVVTMTSSNDNAKASNCRSESERARRAAALIHIIAPSESLA